MASIEMLGPLRAMVGKELMNSLRRCKSLREILSQLLTELQANLDFGQPTSIEEMNRYLIVLINGSIASNLNIELGVGDSIIILPLSHGG